MPTVEVFARDWCPAAYVEHDDEPEACRFAADVEWLTAHGVPVVRATLADQPGRFVEHDAVRFLMNVLGPTVLPVVLVDGFMRSHGTFPTRVDLAAWAGVQDVLAEERLELTLAHDAGRAPTHSGEQGAPTDRREPSRTGSLDAAALLRRFVPEPATPFVVGSPAAAASTADVPAVALRAS